MRQSREERIEREHARKNVSSRSTRNERSGRGLGRALGTLIVIVCKVGLVAAIFAGTGYGLVWLYDTLTTSRYFSIRDVEVKGNVRLEYHDIVRQAGLETGQNNLAVSIDGVEARLEKNPWIRRVSVTRKLPDRLIIEIEEREPRYWIRSNEVMYYADEAGRPIAPVEPARFVALPILEVDDAGSGEGQRAREILEMLNVAQLPLEIDSASWIHVGEQNGVELYLEKRNLRIGIGLENLEANLANLKKVLEDLARRGELGATREANAYGSKVWVLFDVSGPGGG